jgi:hypothetical protein
MRMAQYELEKTEIAARHQALLGQSSGELPVKCQE